MQRLDYLFPRHGGLADGPGSTEYQQFLARNDRLPFGHAEFEDRAVALRIDLDIAGRGADVTPHRVLRSIPAEKDEQAYADREGADKQCVGAITRRRDHRRAGRERARLVFNRFLSEQLHLSTNRNNGTNG